MINIGSLSVIATTQMEAHIGFWSSYLLTFCFFFIAIAALIVGRNKYVKVPVGDKIVNKTFKCVWVGIINGFNFDAAKPPSNQKNLIHGMTILLTKSKELYLLVKCLCGTLSTGSNIMV